MIDSAGRGKASEQSPVKDVLVFNSEAFSIEPTAEPDGTRYDLPLGDDIAAYLKGALEASGTTWDIDDPVREDFGAVLLLSRDKAAFTITVSWQGGYDWALVFDRRRGCLGWLVSSKPDPVRLAEVKAALHRVVFNDSTSFRNARWIPHAEFAGGASAFVIPKD
jgi:hypothetical protein